MVETSNHGMHNGSVNRTNPPAMKLTRRSFLAVSSMSMLAGCAGPDSPAANPEATRAAGPESMAARARLEFVHAVLFKPLPELLPEGLPGIFAPLFLYELRRPDDAAVDELARLGQAFPGLLHPGIEGPLPVVHVVEDQVLLAGEWRSRVSYLWLQPRVSAEGQKAFTSQGVRITLNGAGHPALWEISVDSSRARLVFVSASLEQAAEAAHGLALPGRRFAIEADPREAQGTVVARVLDDGPSPMGPIIYVRPETSDIVTLTCRCMPSQVRSIARTEEYDLLVLDPQRIPDARALAMLSRGFTGAPPDYLEHSLRLPPTF